MSVVVILDNSYGHLGSGMALYVYDSEKVKDADKRQHFVYCTFDAIFASLPRHPA